MKYTRIESPTVRAACDDLLSYFCGRSDFEVNPLTSGPKKSVHFAWQGKDIYAFIANKNWLLWYFRKPGVTVGAFTFGAVQGAFPTAGFTNRKDPNVKEITLKIGSPAEARTIMEFVQNHPGQR
ncbi:MAG: hypothetical protein HKN98_15395 [Silicimonas sp.]|nr:hypothetical protein [Silicimonas sp.]